MFYFKNNSLKKNKKNILLYFQIKTFFKNLLIRITTRTKHVLFIGYLYFEVSISSV